MKSKSFMIAGNLLWLDDPMKIPILILITSCLLAPDQEPPKLKVRVIKEHLKNVPPFLLKRCSEDRRYRSIRSHGGDPATEQAVVDALRFLKNTQSESGNWPSDRTRPVAMTALGLLCFLGHGEITQSEEFGEAVKNAINFLITTAVNNKGKLASDFRDHRWPYEHAVATYALAEAYSLCEKGMGEKITNLKRAMEVCGQFLIDHQHQGGGWDYAFSGDSARGGDTSLTTWSLLALKSCRESGFDFINMTRCYKKGVDYIERMQMPSGAIGYSTPNLHGGQDGTTLAALGATSFQIWKSVASKVPQKAARFIDKEMKFDWNTPDSDLYGLFFAAQTMFRQGGDQWSRFQEKFFPQIFENQAPGGFFLPTNHGDWKTINAVNPSYTLSSPYGVHFRTCLATLTLQTYYRVNRAHGTITVPKISKN